MHDDLLCKGLAVSGTLAREVGAVLDAYAGRLTDLQVAVAAVAQRTQVLCRMAL